MRRGFSGFHDLSDDALAIAGKKGDLAGATAQLSAAVLLNPGSSALHHRLGAFYLRQGRKAEAQKEFDRSFAIFAPWALGNDSSQAGTPADAN